MDPIASCSCGLRVAPEMIGSVKKEGQKMLLSWVCGNGDEGVTVMDLDYYAEYLVRWENYRKWGKTYDPEVVGKRVQAFRIDLDAVIDVSDLELYWHDQDIWAPWTITHEKRVAPL